MPDEMKPDAPPPAAAKPSPLAVLQGLKDKLPKLEKKHLIGLGAALAVVVGAAIVHGVMKSRAKPAPPPVVAAPKPKLKPAPAPEPVPSTAAAAVPIGPTPEELRAQRQAEETQKEEERAAARAKRDKAVEDACANEIGMLCHSVQDDIRAAERCLKQHADDLLPSCKQALEQ